MVRIIGISIAVIIGLVVIAWMLGWILTPLDVTSVRNVKKQWAFAYQYEESLKATAQQVCFVKRAVTNAKNDEERTQRQSQELAFAMNYTRIEAEYNAKLRDAFQAKYVKPSDVPDKAPTLVDMLLLVCK